MSIKIVVFGENEQAAKFVEKSRGRPGDPSDEDVIVENVTVSEANFLLFSVKERSLVSAQATGSNGLLFFLGGDTPLFEEKQFLIDLLESRVEFDGIPVAVLFQKGQQLTLKDVVNYMELYRLKDRASMIKQIGWDQQDWIKDVYAWVKTQSQQSRVRGFQAAPKVVKMKAKYREGFEDQSEKKYQGILEEKEIQAKGVKQQEDVFIEREKDKLKRQNMDQQLSMFSKNKKKMSPYDIKPTPNPKIDPNLHFFLKDPNSQPAPEVSIKIQTDEFKDRPAPAPYKPKKTGINTSTQIQENQLFTFDKEVKPILSILTTKALENAALELEEEEQLAKMVKYRKAYDQKIRKQKEHEQKNIDEQLRIIKEKDRLLKQHREKAEMKKTIQRRAECYQLSNNFLSGIYLQATNKLITSNVYPDSLSNYLKTDYLDNLFSKASVKFEHICKNDLALRGVFDKDIVEPVQKASLKAKQVHQVIKKKRDARVINKSSTTRKVHVLYKHEYLQFSNFSKYLSKHFDGSFEEFIKNREEQVQQVSDKVSTGEVTEEQLLKEKIKDSQAFADAGHNSFLVKSSELCFSITSNKYEYVKDSCISNGVLLLGQEGQILEDPAFGSANSKSDYLRTESRLRESKENINMDDGIVLDLSKVPEKAKCIVILVKISEVQRFKVETQLGKIKNAAYGVEYWKHKIPVHTKNIGQTIKWQEVVKSEGEEAPPSHNAYVVSYVLRRRSIPDNWTIEDVSYLSQAFKSNEQYSNFLEELSKFYYKSNDLLKEEEEEEKVEAPPQSSQGDQKKGSSKDARRSKKVIEEPKKRIVMKVATRVLNEVTILLDQPLEDALKKLTGSVQQWKQFMQSCENGWYLQLKGKKVEQTAQLAAFRKVGDLVLKKVPKPEEPKVEKVEEEGQKVEEEEA